MCETWKIGMITDDVHSLYSTSTSLFSKATLTPPLPRPPCELSSDFTPDGARIGRATIQTPRKSLNSEAHQPGCLIVGTPKPNPPLPRPSPSSLRKKRTNRTHHLQHNQPNSDSQPKNGKIQEKKESKKWKAYGSPGLHSDQWNRERSLQHLDSCLPHVPAGNCA